MLKHYFRMPLEKASVSAKPICTANHFVTKLNLVFLFFFTVPVLQAQCPSPPGNPAVFGNNAWIAYGYDTADLSLATAIYSGYYTQPTLGFNTQDSWNQNSSPANTEGWTGCTLDNDSFTLVYKRKGFPCGTYTVAMTDWDDAAVLYVDGVQLWSCTASSETGGCDGYVDEIVLNEDSEMEIRLREDGGVSFASLSLVNNTPTIAGILAPSGETTICPNTKPGAITLSGHAGNIVKWQSAEDAAFTIDVTDIASTDTVLTSLDMGAIAATRFYRAAVQNSGCSPEYTDPVQITVPEAVVYSDGAWSSPPTETTPIVIDGDMLLIDDLTVCSCLVKDGKTLTVQPDVSLTVATSVTVEAGAALVIEDQGSLVQMDDSAISTGNVTVKRNSQPMKTYDYTYWSSPVEGNTLFQLSPLTLSDKYYSYDPVSDNWVSIPGGAAVMEPGCGYIIRAPQGWGVDNVTSGVYGGSFNGVPNNGVIPATIKKGLGKDNLIGNPYPSAIDIDLFLSDPANAAIVNGTIHLWTHNTAISATIPGNAVYNYTADDYASYNLTGGIRTAAPAITGGSTPDGKIASGQGFFIEAATGLADGTYTVNFNNSMRLAGSNGNFYRPAQQGHTNTQGLEKNRLWLTASNTQGAYSQVLVGYIANATNGADALFDGKPMDPANVLSMYSINGQDHYSIQGRALPFSNTDVVPIGYRTSIAGNFTLALEDFDGLFQNQDVYLLDKLNNIMQELKMGSYEFASAIGTFNDRFEIHYRNSSLSVNNPLHSNAFVVYSGNSQLTLKASAEMTSVAIYDLLGREVYHSGTIHAADFKTPPLNLKNQVLVVKVGFENEAVSYKKVILE